MEGEGFLSVEPGQMVELLDDSQKGAWFVLTIPRFKGEEQMEGFVEQKCLQRVKEGMCVELSICGCGLKC